MCKSTGSVLYIIPVERFILTRRPEYRSPAFHVQSWYDEVKDYTYPYAHECNPWCPERCTGPMCTHYTQIVWATTNKVGCAVNVCKSMNVWGETWENAVYLVCNYSPKGNWIGEAPYKHGRPCSECPPSYGGGCQNDLCHKDDRYAQKPEVEETNEVEVPQVTEDKHVWGQERVTKPAKEGRPSATAYMTQAIKCDTKMRDRCKGSTCNRYLCPAGCLNNKAKVFGTSFYETSSSICRAAIHSGMLDNRGGLVDITRRGRADSFVKSARNGVESLSKSKPANSFILSKVTVQTLDCYTTVEELCPFKKPAAHCPRSYCPAYCKDEPSYWAQVYGTNVYADAGVELLDKSQDAVKGPMEKFPSVKVRNEWQDRLAPAAEQNLRRCGAPGSFQPLRKRPANCLESEFQQALKAPAGNPDSITGATKRELRVNFICQ
ncbi:UNVERIFIED_CONTAM: Cysteine-rich secretory protein LCCL domain-containing 2 [Gekko kuhli]